MPDFISVILLGLIEGITEFLPVSSTGHLLLAEQWLPYHASDAFLVVIQCGAVAAVLLVFQARVRQLLGSLHDPLARDYVFKLAGAFFVTAAGGLVMKKLGFKLPETATPIAVALLVGGVLFIAVERWLKGRRLNPAVSWPVALAIGAAQILAAVFPGTSRSGATILVALVMGLEREAAIEFSFLLGVPTLLAAGALELLSQLKHGTEPMPWGLLLLGSLVSAVTAFAAIKWMISYLRRHTFEGFGWYRIALGVVVLMFALSR